MYAEFKDVVADQMRDLAKGISSPTERFAARSDSLAKAGPIVSQFFPQKEMNVEPLSTEELVTSMAGADNARRARFREAMRQQHPANPGMWDVPPPTPPERTFMGGMSWAPEKAKSGGALSKSAQVEAEAKGRLARLGNAIVRLEAAKTLKDGIDQGELDPKVVAGALA